MLGGLALASFVITVVGLRLLLGRFGLLALDRPNERSLHDKPVPRTGGVALLAGAAASVPFGASALWPELCLAFGLAVVSFTDDIRGLPTGARLVAHMVAAGVLVWYVLSPMHPIELIILAIAVAWITNLYNFMDGSDGLAGGMALFGFGTYAVAAASAGDLPLLALTAALAASALGFLVFNFPPARIFLGDVGSVPLGFLAAALGIVGWRDDAWPLWFPVAVFGVFIGDATLTLAKRLVRRERVWQPHREHYYQRLVRMGLGHRRTALLAYALMLACTVVALYGRTQAPAAQWTLFGVLVALLAAVALVIDMRWAKAA